MKTAYTLIILILLLGACSEKPGAAEPDSKSCKLDVECICGGTDRLTGECFIGNRGYYDTFVDQSKTCPDFCSGIGGNLETRCIGGACTQVSRQQEPECAKDEDCATGGCSSQVCAKAADAKELVTTCEWKAEYGCLQTHAACGCDNGKCGWKKSEGFEECMTES